MSGRFTARVRARKAALRAVTNPTPIVETPAGDVLVVEEPSSQPSPQRLPEQAERKTRAKRKRSAKNAT